eukprot:snap_masked-scaffold_11-processed-gene-11.16-mRNA-1 protein AED:0.28 eAED:0.28 QI:0/-1/0/1/-1/1/1/0/253
MKRFLSTNPYRVLGLSPGASKAEIKKSYKKLALKYHPDRNKSPEATQRFKEISEAYVQLKDGNKNYQQQFQGNPFGQGFNPFENQQFRGQNPFYTSGFQRTGRPGGFVDPFDLFEEIFRNEQQIFQQRGRQKNQRGKQVVLVSTRLEVFSTPNGPVQRKVIEKVHSDGTVTREHEDLSEREETPEEKEMRKKAEEFQKDLEREFKKEVRGAVKEVSKEVGRLAWEAAKNKVKGIGNNIKNGVTRSVSKLFGSR